MHTIPFIGLILTRLIAATCLGFGIGLEREITNKYAGLRTHILVCIGSCVFTILSVYAFPAAVYGSHGDPARIAAQVLTGIGFIGGGTVLRHGSSVTGLTTAATLWVAASIGMACGAGHLDVAFFATLFSVIVLVGIRLFEKNILHSGTKHNQRLKIIIICDDINAMDVHNYIIEKFDHMHEISKKRNGKDDNLTKIIAKIDISAKRPIQSLYQDFQKLHGLESVSIQEDDE